MVLTRRASAQLNLSSAPEFNQDLIAASNQALNTSTSRSNSATQENTRSRRLSSLRSSTQSQQATRTNQGRSGGTQLIMSPIADASPPPQLSKGLAFEPLTPTELVQVCPQSDLNTLTPVELTESVGGVAQQGNCQNESHGIGLANLGEERETMDSNQGSFRPLSTPTAADMNIKVYESSENVPHAEWNGLFDPSFKFQFATEPRNYSAAESIAPHRNPPLVDADTQMNVVEYNSLAFSNMERFPSSNASASPNYWAYDQETIISTAPTSHAPSPHFSATAASTIEEPSVLAMPPTVNETHFSPGPLNLLRGGYSSIMPTSRKKTTAPGNSLEKGNSPRTKRVREITPKTLNTNPSSSSISRATTPTPLNIDEIAQVFVDAFQSAPAGTTNFSRSVTKSAKKPKSDLSPTKSATEERKRRNARSKPVGYAPRPPNAWILYRSAQIALLKNDEEFTKTPQSDISKLIGYMWRDESAQVRQEYERKAAEKKAEHAILYPDYVYQPVRKTKTLTGLGPAIVFAAEQGNAASRPNNPRRVTAPANSNYTKSLEELMTSPEHCPPGSFGHQQQNSLPYSAGATPFFSPFSTSLPPPEIGNVGFYDPTQAQTNEADQEFVMNELISSLGYPTASTEASFDFSSVPSSADSTAWSLYQNSLNTSQSLYANEMTPINTNTACEDVAYTGYPPLSAPAAVAAFSFGPVAPAFQPIQEQTSAQLPDLPAGIDPLNLDLNLPEHLLNQLNATSDHSFGVYSPSVPLGAPTGSETLNPVNGFTSPSTTGTSLASPLTPITGFDSFHIKSFEQMKTDSYQPNFNSSLEFDENPQNLM